MIVLALIAWILLNKTRFGRYVYALGGSVETVRLAGINVKSVYVRIYTFIGFLSAVSGLVLCARLSSGQPMAGSGWELDAIAAVVVGGGNIAGGRATIVGTMIGAFIIGLLNNGLNLMNVSPYLQNVVKGFVILSAVLLRSGFNKDK
jgi:ribose transport system permease protein